MLIKLDTIKHNMNATNTPQGGAGVPPRGTNPDDRNPPKDKDDQKKKDKK